MTSYAPIADIPSPLAQTFIVSEDSVLTGIGLWFFSKPTDINYPVSLELRTISEGGNPSSRVALPGTRVTKVPSAVTASTTFDGSANETKFSFPDPVFVPGGSTLALVVWTNATPDDYKVWYAEMGEYYFGTTEKRITTQPEIGSFYSSSNNTTWTAEQTKDLAFKVYRAVFETNTTTNAVLYPSLPAVTPLSPIRVREQPLNFTAGDSDVKVIHPSHGFIVGDTVRLSGLDSATTYSGVRGSSIIGARTITAVDPYGYTITMDSAADSSIRGGGVNMFATEQYMLDGLSLKIPTLRPDGTTIVAKGNFTTGKSFAGTETAYAANNGVALKLNDNTWFRDPHLIASGDQETNRLSGNPSTAITISMATANPYVAPYLDASIASIEASTIFIDNQDSAVASTGKNAITTIPFVPETEPFGGTNAAKHLMRPVTLATSATSIRVLIDANRPSFSDFTVWYRTALTNSIEDITKKQWVAFSKTDTTTNPSNYNTMPSDDAFANFREYRFNVFDLPEFDTYQIKITMNSTKSTFYPRFKNLRTIVTI